MIGRLRPRGLRLERHALEAHQLGALTLPVSDDGIVIGHDQERIPAVLGLFRPEPYEISFVGGAYLIQVIALRAAAIGARVAIESGRPHLWASLAQQAGGGQQCITVHPVGRLGPQGPSAASPVLVVRDCGARPPRNRLAATPWETTLTLLPFLDPGLAGRLAEADLVGLQRVSPTEAQAAAHALNLAPQDGAALPSLADELTLWCTRRTRRYVLLGPTQVEVGFLGPPRRMD